MVLLFVLQELWAKSFLHHNDRHSCFHWPGAVLTLVVVVGLLCCHGSQPDGRWAGMSDGAKKLLNGILNGCYQVVGISTLLFCFM